MDPKLGWVLSYKRGMYLCPCPFARRCDSVKFYWILLSTQYFLVSWVFTHEFLMLIRGVFYPWKRGFHPHHNLLLVVRRRRSQRCPLVARKRTRNRFIQNEAAVSTFSDWTRSICFHLSSWAVIKVFKSFPNHQNFFKKVFQIKSTVFDFNLSFININQPPSSVYNKRKSFKALVLFHYSSSFFTFKKT